MICTKRPGGGWVNHPTLSFDYITGICGFQSPYARPSAPWLQPRSSFSRNLENITFRRFFELTRRYVYQKKENRNS